MVSFDGSETETSDNSKQPTSTYRANPNTDRIEQHSNEENSEKKLLMSGPILQSLPTRSNRAAMNTPMGSTEDIVKSQGENPTSAFATSADAADLSKKLSALMRQATEKELPPLPNSKSSVSTRRSKHSRLQRGKEAFTRAKQAIADRLSSSGEKRLGSRKRQAKHVPSSSSDEIAGPSYQTDADVRRHRLGRRIAEGTNLSNSKVKSLTGDGNVRRKPLPVYERMKSLQRQLSSSDDPFSDEKSPIVDVSSPEFDFDFDVEVTGHRPANLRRTSTFEPLLSNAQLEKSEPCHQFSGLKSGLAQHPDTSFFSSSPAEYSTPRYRLEPQFDTKGKKRLSIVLAPSPSLLQLGLDGQRGDGSSGISELQEPLEADKARSTTSLKRKTAKMDLRINTSPASKKVKTQDVPLAAELAKLHAGNDGPLAMKDSNKRTSKSRIPGVKGKGLKIFDVGKGNAPLPRMIDALNKTKGSPSERRSSIPAPIKRIAAHERRASTPVRSHSIEDDSMSIDELQLP